jgi:hypothetical protein
VQGNKANSLVSYYAPLLRTYTRDVEEMKVRGRQRWGRLIGGGEQIGGRVETPLEMRMGGKQLDLLNPS